MVSMVFQTTDPMDLPMLAMDLLDMDFTLLSLRVQISTVVTSPILDDSFLFIGCLNLRRYKINGQKYVFKLAYTIIQQISLLLLILSSSCRSRIVKYFKMYVSNVSNILHHLSIVESP